MNSLSMVNSEYKIDRQDLERAREKLAITITNIGARYCVTRTPDERRETYELLTWATQQIKAQLMAEREMLLHEAAEA
jgi:hypothetical protein